MKKIWQKIMTTDFVIAKSYYLTFDPAKGSGGGVNFFDTVMLIYRHSTIMAHGEKLSDIIVLVEM